MKRLLFNIIWKTDFSTHQCDKKCDIKLYMSPSLVQESDLLGWSWSWSFFSKWSFGQNDLDHLSDLDLWSRSLFKWSSRTLPGAHLLEHPGTSLYRIPENSLLKSALWGTPHFLFKCRRHLWMVPDGIDVAAIDDPLDHGFEEGGWIVLGIIYIWCSHIFLSLWYEQNS